MNYTHDGGLDLPQTIRVLRTLDAKYQESVCGLASSPRSPGTRLLLTCGGEEAYQRWVRAWRELAV